MDAACALRSPVGRELFARTAIPAQLARPRILGPSFAALPTMPCESERGLGYLAVQKTARKDVHQQGGERLRLSGLSRESRKIGSFREHNTEFCRTRSPALRAGAGPKRQTGLARGVCAAMAVVGCGGAKRAASGATPPRGRAAPRRGAGKSAAPEPLSPR